ncbi:CTP synthetase [Candidatus Woesearchaeota archaeon CG10_big_fil_rev_8_21_14_0_10_44_13]|nr:MAG: CTP synthetase [Candidatus Woesearchaeota archaeon CG10_big_fil_rev_8_21_14_0_10_44_13]
MHTKFIVVTGGVLSGVGKGTITASIGKLLSLQGYKVASIKIDPYINIDAGTMRPTEHGEVFVTEDGGETDQDLGIYERFIGNYCLKEQNMTTGQVYETVIHKERNLEYGGRCVEVIPHIPEEVKRRIKAVAEKNNADFCLIEVGGTVGDYQNVLFLEALREMRLQGEKIVFVHVAYLPVPGNLGEMKTKPAQRSVRDLNSIGIQPDFIVTRSAMPLDDVRKEKLSLFCNVVKDDVISSPDVRNIYEVPLVLESQDFTSKVLSKFNMVFKTGKMKEWEAFVESTKKLEKEARIGIIGKYFDTGDFTLEDSYISVIEAVKHACWNNGFRPKIEWINSKDYEKDDKLLQGLKSYDAIIVPGGFGKSGVEGKIKAIRFARENKIPYLGLCYGMQLAVIEFARNVCGMKDANTTENDPKTRFPVIDIMPEQKKIIAESKYGATMRLGAYKAVLKKGSIVHKLYGKDEVSERHRHRYEVNPEFISKLEAKGLVFSGKSPDGKLMEFIEIQNHIFMVGTQGHPEFKSYPMKPSPLFDGLVKAIKK